MDEQQLIPHLFRSEFRKIVAVLAKFFGPEHIEVAEDIASETFLRAMETWAYKGVPQNPTAWLYTVAKNKARNHLLRSRLFHEKIANEVRSESSSSEPEIDLSEKNISDSQLQMLFAVCHPSIQPESQIALSLRFLCGFGIEEIANAFLTNKETINKRLFRAKEKLRHEKIKIAFPERVELHTRMETVLRTLYLLFNEGYYSESQDQVVREDLCLEAIRLTYLLVENQETNTPETNALLALMCLHSSRFAARKNDRGEIVLYNDQDENLWDQALITKGVYYLNQASKGDRISKFHLEAAIAYWHTVKSDTREKWENIHHLYNQLLKIEYSPMAALNRTFALFKANGRHEALREAEKLKLTDNHYYFLLMGELYRGENNEESKKNFQKAWDLARTKPEKDIIKKKMDDL